MITFDTASKSLNAWFREYAKDTDDYSVANYHKMCKEVMQSPTHCMYESAMYMWNPDWRNEYAKRNK